MKLKAYTVACGLVFFASIIITVFTVCGSTPATPTTAPPKPEEPFIDMIAIPGGAFRMGSPRNSGLIYERPDHQVTLRPFFLSKYEVTQGQYFEITGMRPSSCISNPEDPDSEGWKSLPVEMINWYEALVFCNELSIKEKLEPVYRINGSVDTQSWGAIPVDEIIASWGMIEWIEDANGYRLPTESEWEYAARGGHQSQSFTYAGGNNPDDLCWYYENSKTMSHTVGQKSPNELGLHDMSGNVMEWCWDWQASYTATAKHNPTGPSTGLYKVIRGGSWSYALAYCLVARRHSNHPYYRGVNLGFRVARSQ